MNTRYLIASHGLTTYPEGHGPEMPTSQLTPEILMAAREMLQPIGKVLCELSWVANDRLAYWTEDPTIMTRLKMQFDFYVQECPERHDMVNGAWERRSYGTLNHENASTEDASITDHKAENQVIIRYRRVKYGFSPEPMPLP